jgi:cellulose synthase/poly-beta-1,6-N-acetylglucosamine synthase-like glycosyltransferase
MAMVSYSLAVLAGLLAIPVTVFCLEVAAAIALRPRDCLMQPSNGVCKRVAVLVPAHNESTRLLPTIEDIKVQLRNGDRLLVVADNCSDDTAAVAAEAEAEVVERGDLDKIGKGYALDWGLRYLSANPPEIVVIIDADCRLADGAIQQLARICAKTRRPVQALYLMTAPDHCTISCQVAQFAWRVKNWVRPLGLSRFGLPCQLMGTGMAFPWDIIHSADLATGQIVEDLKLGLDLALAGAPPMFFPSAVVTSEFPASVRGTDSQRQRWEYGHIELILTLGARFIFLAIARRNLALLALALDMAIPPVTVLGLLVIGMAAIAGLSVCFGSSPVALFVSGVSLVALVLAVLLSWLRYGHDVLPLGSSLLIGPYVVGKLRLYRQFLQRGFVLKWKRTDRGN